MAGWLRDVEDAGNNRSRSPREHVAPHVAGIRRAVGRSGSATPESPLSPQLSWLDDGRVETGPDFADLRSVPVKFGARARVAAADVRSDAARWLSPTLSPGEVQRPGGISPRAAQP